MTETGKHHHEAGWFRSQLTLTNIIVIGTFVFTVGSWWTRTDALEVRMTAIERRVERDAESVYLRRDVSAEQLRAIDTRLANIEHQIESLTRTRR